MGGTLKFDDHWVEGNCQNIANGRIACPGPHPVTLFWWTSGVVRTGGLSLVSQVTRAGEAWGAVPSEASPGTSAVIMAAAGLPGPVFSGSGATSGPYPVSSRS